MTHTHTEVGPGNRRADRQRRAHEELDRRLNHLMDEAISDANGNADDVTPIFRASVEREVRLPPLWGALLGDARIDAAIQALYRQRQTAQILSAAGATLGREGGAAQRRGPARQEDVPSSRPVTPARNPDQQERLRRLFDYTVLIDGIDIERCTAGRVRTWIRQEKDRIATARLEVRYAELLVESATDDSRLVGEYHDKASADHLLNIARQETANV